MTEPLLRYFVDFLPLAARIKPMDRAIEQICAAYDTSAGVDPSALGEDAAVLRHVLVEADAQWQEQVRMARVLPDYWRGDAASRAHESMLGNIDRAEGSLSAVRETVDALDAAQSALADVIRGRADAMGCFPTAIDGRAAQDISALVDRAIETSDAECLAWLEQVFVPHVRESLDVFDDICGAADDAVASTMGVLDRVLAQVDEHAAVLASAALAGVGGIAIAAGELALTLGTELVDEFASRDESSEPAPPSAPSSEVPHVRDRAAEPGASPDTRAVVPDHEPAVYETPWARNEPAIALKPSEPDAAQADSDTSDEGQPLLASAGDETVVEEPRIPGVQLGEAGPL